VFDAPSGLKLDLADGRRWVIRPADNRAVPIVAELGRVMRLGSGEVGRELYVAVRNEAYEQVRSVVKAGGPVVCRLFPPTNRDTHALQMQRVASVIARETLVGGGLLLHGALAEYQGSGFIMAGPGQVGKSTASARLLPPWRSLCDDTTLVVRDPAGRWWAHPWPTWSRFLFDGPGGSWPVECAVPLRAIFFLVQSPSDRLKTIETTQATALTLESMVDVASDVSRLTDANAARALCGDGLRAARALASAVPAYSLQFSLEGRFWDEIERALPGDALPEPGETSRDQGPAPAESLIVLDSRRLVYTGTSMSPTLLEPELLQVEPYGKRRVLPGDVVCFKSPEEDQTVVHRVVDIERRKTADGRPQKDIRTRGDNNTADDPWVLQPADIIGRVTAAQCGTRCRAIPGGWQGLLGLRSVRLGRAIRMCAGFVPHRLYCFVIGLGPFDRLLPPSLRPRLVRFEAHYRVFLKLQVGRLTVGQYDDRREVWRIKRPFRLFVNEHALPRPKSE
jgi:SynChlorMet cassette protein ScmC